MTCLIKIPNTLGNTCVSGIKLTKDKQGTVIWSLKEWQYGSAPPKKRPKLSKTNSSSVPKGGG